jgi:hypothetical protein
MKKKKQVGINHIREGIGRGCRPDFVCCFSHSGSKHICETQCTLCRTVLNHVTVIWKELMRVRRKKERHIDIETIGMR